MRKQKNIDEVMIELAALKKVHGGKIPCSMKLFIHKDENDLLPIERDVGDAVILNDKCVIRSV
ncbi:hypothetical protein KAR91_07150 [Candidatus Pacearchaeota archaeon]|nr:hypothetical protein [Candidatus Pacearchaeota archaeon]